MSNINPTRKVMQRIAWFFIILMINQIVFPAAALALTAGPAQPEYKSFAAAGSTEMVNLFSGDFNYNIPLLEVPGSDGGYPINLFYSSVLSPDEEASWTGLGWNINVGSLSRTMRGLPDDFNGEDVSRKLDMRPDETTTVGVSGAVEFGGYDPSEAIKKIAGTGLSLTINYVYNSYKGGGISIDPLATLNVNAGVSFGNGLLGYSPNFKLGMSVSTIDAAKANVGIRGGSAFHGLVSGRLSLNANARKGLDYSLGLSVNLHKRIQLSGTVSFAKNTYTPEVLIPWTGGSTLWNGNFMAGGAYVFGKVGLGGSHSITRVENGGTWQSRPAYGLNYLQNSNEHSVLDFNREKDGLVHRHNRYLANPILTHDVYNVSGQGIGGVFRTHRSDYGILHEPSLYSDTHGASIGFEGGVAFEFGGNGMGIYRFEKNNQWPLISAADFHSTINSTFEPFYYKMAGDISAEDPTTYDYLGKDEARDKPLFLKREEFDINKDSGGELMGEKEANGTPISGTYETKLWLNTDKNHRESRKSRNVSVQPITNHLLRDVNGNEELVEYDVKYYSKTNLNNYEAAPNNELIRPNNNQNAGFTVLGQSGVRWIYGLPVLNHEQKEAKFSVAAPSNPCSKRVDVVMDGDRNTIHYKPSNNNLRSNDYIDEQKVPSYVHTHLLTSVLGNDYGDVDTIPGPSDGDVGYWMKTNYVKLSDNYQWRAPFSGANYITGVENNVMDDLGLMTWGSRDVYLPATVETSTHIAYFDVSKRFDARGANYYIQNWSDINNKTAFGEYSYKLDKIRLYSKAEIAAKGGVSAATPLKTVHLEYDYSLCKGVENNNPTDTDPELLAANTSISERRGKLTLKKVWFTYEKSNKGELSPYQFEYSASNPNYDDSKIDRWGVYREEFLDGSYEVCDNMNLPYVNQDPANKVNQDADVAAWHLKRIVLPSGSSLAIELERDDYAYVQDATATRMFQIASVADNHANSIADNNANDDDLLEHQEGSFRNRQIKFKLETPIAPSDPDALKKLDAYISDLPIEDRYGQPHKQLYYKIRMNLRQTDNALWEYVPGYADIEKDEDGREIHFDNLDPSTGMYTHAYITLRGSRIQLASTGQRFHPMAMTSWKFLRDNLPDKFLTVDLGGPPNAMTSLDQLGANIDAVFKGFYNYAYQNRFAKVIDLKRSFIRLNTPDKVQYGGGARVKKITLDDNWAATSSETSTLGVAYDYTTTDEDGNTISSGVVENEPYIGYDECALRWADVNEEAAGGIVRDVFHYEYPLNEGYHPGGNVGYSKVSVRSLASDYAYQEDQGKTIPNDLQNKDFSTTGQTVHEYYTAKDFPIVTAKTVLDDEETNPWAVMLLEIISLNRMERYMGTQGYSIELNNMHGQMKRVSTYVQLPSGAMDVHPLKKIEYTYKSKKIVDTRRGHKNKKINVLDNEVEVLLNDDPEQAATVQTQLLGVDYDFFIDGREVEKAGSAIGAQINTTYTPLWLFGIFPWPQVKFNETKVRTTVANKIINRTGILERVDAYDGQSHISTKNLVFNAQTGAPILTTVDNQLGGDIYNYSVPAYLAHSRMGAANENIGINYTAIPFNEVRDNCTGYYQVSGAVSPTVEWIEGDEFIARLSYDANNKYKMIYMGELFNAAGNKVHQFDLIDAPTPPSNFSATMTTTRSGNRNLLNATIAQYSTIDIDGNPLLSQANPLTDRTIGSTTWTAEMYPIAIQGGYATLATPVTGSSLSPAILNNVLSASAVDFSDNWTLEDYNYCSNVSINNVNPYITGEKGVWRTKSSYIYIDDREQQGLAQKAEEVDIRKSGVMNNFPLFNWKNPFMEHASASKWVRSQDITKYHQGGQSVESRDVLGNYQATLYGYNDNLVTAQGVNTTHYELGYEGFEEPNQIGSFNNLASNGAINAGHIDFYPMSCGATTIKRNENYRLTYPMQKPTGNKGLILVRKTFNSSTAVPANTKAILHLNNGQEQHTVQATVTKKYPLRSNNQRYKVAGLTNLIDNNTEGDYTVYELDLSNCTNPAINNSDWWAGDVTLEYEVPVQAPHPSTGNDFVNDTYAHTGKYSLKIDKSETSSYQHKHTFHQNTLRLQYKKDYVISAWVKVVSANRNLIEPLPTYAYNKQRNITFCGKVFEPSGPIIDGWQRIEGTATYFGDDDIIIQDNTNPKDYVMYVDDIRVFPATGNMISHVYDPIDYKLRATLDDNNYATFYVYDPSGALISTKQETEKGIVTVQESRSHIQATN